jgi:hypothetical protein
MARGGGAAAPSRHPERFDPGQDVPRLAEEPARRRWDELMPSMPQRVARAGEGGWWDRMEEVCRLQDPHPSPLAAEGRGRGR